MVLDIKPIHNQGLDCFEDLAISLAEHYNREYSLVFVEGFRFEYSRPETEQEILIGKYIYRGMKNILNLISEYCGINSKMIRTKTAQEVIQVINEQLHLGLPTGIYIESYWCPWTRDYKNFNHPHFCLAIGVDDGGNIICIDPAMGLDTYSLPYNDFINGFGSCCTYSIGQPPREISYELVLKNAVEKIPSTNMFANMRMFITDFDTRLNYHEEFKCFDTCLFDVLLHRNISNISGERQLFSRFIKYIYEKTQNSALLDVSDDLLYVKSKWSVADAILIKAYHSGYSDKVKEKVCNVLKEILEIEERIYDKLVNIVRGNYDLQYNRKVTQNSEMNVSNEYVFVDLEKYYNNIAFHSTCTKECSADFTGTGQYLLSHNAPSGQVIKSNDMVFKFPDLCDNSPDNISCNGQKIYLPEDTYKGIMFLGTAEWGSFIDNAKIENINGNGLNVKINFSDWVIEKTLFDEKIICKVKYFEKKQSSILSQNDCNITAIYRTIEDMDNLVSITLPSCPNIHIFAITLCK